MIWAAAFAIHLMINRENEITLEQHCLLFSISEPLCTSYIVKPGAHLPSRPESLGLLTRGRVDVATLIDHGVTY